MGERVTIPTTTNPPPAGVAIDDTYVVEQTNLDPSFSQAEINGVDNPNALIMQTGGTAGEIQINAERSERIFQGELGIPDDQPSADVFQVKISLDNAAPVFSVSVHFGVTYPIDLDVSGVLRIKIDVNPIVSSSGDTVAIGSPMFHG